MFVARLLLMIASFYALFTCCLLLNMRAELLQRESRTQWVRKLAAVAGNN